ncbi:MAG: hypothetical protein ABIJ31_15135 [Pseudomonadota bacterium]
MTPEKKDLILKGFIAVFVVYLVVSMFGSSGPKLDKALKKQAKAIPDLIETTADRVDQNKDKYASLKKSEEFKPIQVFAQKENWDNLFVQAHQVLTQAKTRYDQNLYPLIKTNTPDVTEPVKKGMNQIKEVISDAEKLSQKPALRFASIRQTMNNAGPYHEKAREDATRISHMINMIQTGVVAKALNEFPDLAEKINARFAPAAKLGQESAANLDIITTQYARHTAGQDTDYAAFADSVQALTSALAQAQTLETTISRQMAQLNTSYTKILKDMKEDYFVTIKRESWDENSDYYDPRFATYTRQVSPEAYEILTAEGIDAIGTITAGFTGSRFSNQVGSAWDELKIDPADQWPSRSHNAATFYVEDSDEAFYHKYILEQDGETKETDWERVDETFYDANIEFLGMAILSKPYGAFEEDQITQATPPGMAYVGNDKYGEWKQDDKGDRFWSWYGKYALFSHLFFFPPSYYYYNSWSGWRNNYGNQRPYFGQTANGSQLYGTHGSAVKQSPKFQNTNFAQSGGFKSQAASVRGAGANLRGGGPKSKGK